MKAVVLMEGHRVGMAEVPEPRLQKNDDVLVQVTAAAICGSDIHIKHGQLPGIAPGTVMGHEFVGVVRETGADVSRFEPGDRVSVPAAVWCGTCPACRRGQIQYCPNGGVWGGGEFFGKGLAGAQTSYVRVPYADMCLTPIPDQVSDEQAVFVGDVFSTGYHAALEGGIATGDTVAVFGCGPIGLAALISAWQMGPREVFAVDMFDNRLEIAQRYGATIVDAREENAVERLREATGGEGVDAVIEAIGNPATFQQALRSVRRGGTVSVVGLFPAPVEFPLNELAYYGVRINMGLGSLAHMPQLMGLLEAGRVDLTPLATHSFALEDAVEAYDLFENRKDACIKVILKP
ncbi:zinc-dependent alcohol dehydrogenase [Desulfatiglans anilini]|uniref:zinc-dependent alcohol dehydrogenase n=1 Tax=Desulfatiglans anilini TaxID=90728 RepID=UPI0003F6FF4B|nr:alcohol dehydrogenase catalytic domain-containing protein [Desulfatiglans anilini]